MAKRNTLNKKKLTFAVQSAVPVRVVKGKLRASVNPGLSEKAVSKIERYEAASQGAEQRLGHIRLG